MTIFVNKLITSILLAFLLFLGVGFVNSAQARGRYGSHRVGGYNSHGKGSHYVGGYVRSCHGVFCK
jgi:hypothetical protein